LLKATYGGAEPVTKSFFDHPMVAGFIQGGERLPLAIQGNVTAGDLLGGAAGRDEVHEEAGAAGLSLILTIEVHASERVLENEGGPTGRLRRTAVAAVFQKAELELEKIQKVAIVFCRFGHGDLT